jgi:hypothetical protein
MNKFMLMTVVGVVAMSLNWNSQAFGQGFGSDMVDDPVVQYSENGDVLGEAPVVDQTETRASVSGQVLVIQSFGCGSYRAVAATQCPVATNLPNCDDVPAGAYCEADGECGLNQSLNNCNPGGWDIYIRTGW